MRISDWSSDVCSSDLFAPEIDHLLRRERVIHANHVLLDDRPLVQVRRNKMRRRTDQLHAAPMRAMIRLGALEAGQNRVMNIDAESLQLVAEIVRQNMNIASQPQQINVPFAHQTKNPSLLLRF